MQKQYVVFGVARRATALVAASMRQAPDSTTPRPGYPCYFFLDELEDKGIDFVRRMLGDIALGILRIHHPAALNKFVFQPVIGTRLYDGGSNVVRLRPPAERVVARDRRARRPQPPMGMAFGMPFSALAPHGPNGAATSVGDVIIRTLTRLHPAAFAPFPGLYVLPPG